MHGKWCLYYCYIVYVAIAYSVSKKRRIYIELTADTNCSFIEAASLKLLTSCSCIPWVMNAWNMVWLLEMFIFNSFVEKKHGKKKQFSGNKFFFITSFAYCRRRVVSSNILGIHNIFYWLRVPYVMYLMYRTHCSLRGSICWTYFIATISHYVSPLVGPWVWQSVTLFFSHSGL